MNVRLIGGHYGGRIIDAPDGATTHPMSERIRGALFNILGERVAGTRVLDAFAGTGAVGLEALSRGAQTATFIERDKLAFIILQRNLELIGANGTATKASLGAWLDTYSGDKFDVIIADPPFTKPQDGLVDRLSAMLAESGVLILSRSTRHVPALASLRLTDSRVYGDATLDFYCRIDVQ